MKKSSVQTKRLVHRSDILYRQQTVLTETCRQTQLLWPELASRVFGWTELLSEDVSQTRQSFICPQVYYKAKRHIGGFAKGLMYYTVMWYIRVS